MILYCFNGGMKMKRFIFVILSLLIAGGMVFARGSSQSVSSQTGGPVEFTATFAPGVYHGDPNDMVLYDRLTSLTNVKPNWIVIPGANWSERKNLMINSGDMPEVFYMGSFGRDEVETYGRQGVFIDLTDPIRQYAPNLVRIMGRDPIYKASITNPSDGKIYNVAGMNNRIADTLTGTMFIYQPWLDKLGIPFPTTYLEFENMLRAFKTRDPNGNGRADEYPFVFANGWSANSSLQQFFAMFGYGYQGIRPGANSFVETSDGRAVFVPGTTNFREAIVWLHKLFSEGLLAEEDYAAMDRNLFSAKMFADPVVAGSFSAFHKNSAYAPEERYDDYVRISTPLKGPHGDQIYMQNSKIYGLGGTFIITQRGAGKTADLMRWLDACFEPEMSKELCFGPIGVTLEKRPNGMIGFIPTPSDTNYNQFRYGQAPGTGIPFYIGPEEWGTTMEIMEEDRDRIPWVQNELKPYLTQWFVYQYPIASETQFMQTRGQEIETFVKTTQARWLMQGGIESEWDSFQARLRTMGVDEYTRVMQSQVDRFAQYSR